MNGTRSTLAEDGRHYAGGGGGGGGGDLAPLRLLPGRRTSSGTFYGANGSATNNDGVMLQVLEAAQYAGDRGGVLVSGAAHTPPRAPGHHSALALQFDKYEAQYDQQQQQHHQQQQRFVVDPEAGHGRARGGDSGSAKASAAAGGGALAQPPTPATLRRNSRLALLSMLLLVFQGTALSIMLRYSRARAGQAYLASVSVIFTEVIKLVICLAMQYRAVVADLAASASRAAGGSQQQRSQALVQELRRQGKDIAAKSLPMLLPAAMFVMQQVLLIIAATHLDAVAFQIFSQSFKLVPTALFAWWLLGQMLEPVQWASIPVLAVGVVLVTVNNGPATGAHRSAAAVAAMSRSHGMDYVAGMVACSISGLSSAYAGVYFEKYVKGKHAASLWVRNIQLGLYGVPLSTAYALLKDGWHIHTGGVMQGFDSATWIVIALQVFGGLVTGMVVKYCDNILKNFALAISVILTVLVAVPLFGQWPSPIFLAGVGMVLLSVFMYGRALDARKLQLLWQRGRKRWHDVGGSRGRGLALLLLLAGTAAAGVVLLGRSSSGSKQLTRNAGGSGSHLTAADIAAGLRREGGAGSVLSRVRGGGEGGAGRRKGGVGADQQQQQQQHKAGRRRQQGQRQKPNNPL